MQTPRMCIRILAALAISLGAASQQAAAATINFDFDASLQTGTLTGTQFAGTASYDNHGLTGSGTEFVSLTSLDFSLLGFPVTLADISQGGQAILQDGTVAYFTAAFFLGSPAPVNDLAFGFGGPGIIGYRTGSDIGSGVYTISSAATPEPSTVASCGVTLLLAAGLLMLDRRSRTRAALRG